MNDLQLALARELSRQRIADATGPWRKLERRHTRVKARPR
jgi:hypothetical protein